MGQPMGDSSDDSRDGGSRRKVGLRDRLAHFTWANFVCTQSTGGVAILLSETPMQFHGLQTAGAVVFIFNLALFILFCAFMITRFVLHPHKLRPSLTSGPEAFFFASFLLSIATVIICIERFGVPHVGPWLIVATRVLFWIYAAASLLFSTTIWVVLGSTPHLKTIPLNPAMFLMVFNAMLTGTTAGAIAGTQPPDQRLPILVAGVAYQGLGWILCMFLLGWYLGSIIERGLGGPNVRPALFMPVGSSGYTIVALIACARNIPTHYGYFGQHPAATEILQVVALWSSIFLWLVAFWIFAVALIANIPVIWPIKNGRYEPQMSFGLSWWGMIFPNVGFTIGTGYIGTELGSPAIEWVATVMTAILFVAWLFNLILHFKAIITGQIMWPGKDEDAIKLK
ncbi:voltage-dependent anion channel [Xylariaceae sp. FL0255]|nr:voltage-dependent anion channel [Xylariaceae sp. FL0255]